MDFETYGMIGVIAIVILLAILVFTCVWIVASTIASHIGLTGIVWWAFSIVLFMLINGLLGGLTMKSVD